MKLSCYSYRLPFRQSFKSSRQVYQNREGFIFCLSGPDFKCYGESAPLPGFSLETFSTTQTHIEKFTDKWLEILETEHPIRNLRTHYSAAETSAELRFGLDALAYQLQAHKERQSLRTFLFENHLPSLPVNGLLSLVENTDPVSSVEMMVDRGFQTIKCKVGVRFKREREQLGQIRSQFPNLGIRLDANQAWSLNEAISSLNALESIGIEYCEEPLRQPTVNNYRELNQQTSLPVALDESICKSRHWRALMPFCSVLIVKPMVIGGFEELFTVCQQAKKYDCSIVFSSSLESSIGRTITAVLASGLGSPDFAHGLNTGSLLSRDINLDQPKIISGSIQLDDIDTIVVDQAYLETIAEKVTTADDF